MVDNYSRRILAWRLAEKLSPVTTCEVLAKAAENLKGKKSPVSVLTDGGGENVNDTVDEFLSGVSLKRVVAQVEIAESNSLVEAFWRILRHQWLYLNTLDTVAAVRRLVSFYVQQHNEAMPHSALNGRTPDEAYFGKGEDVPVKLAAAREAAQARRLAQNRTVTCKTCTLTAEARTSPPHNATRTRWRVIGRRRLRCSGDSYSPGAKASGYTTLMMSGLAGNVMFLSCS